MAWVTAKLLAERAARAEAQAAPSSAWSGSRSAAAGARRAPTARSRSRCRRRRPPARARRECAPAPRDGGERSQRRDPGRGHAPARLRAGADGSRDHAGGAVGQRPQPVGDERAPGREHRHEGERDRVQRRQAHGGQPPAPSAAADLEAVQRWSRRTVHSHNVQSHPWRPTRDVSCPRSMRCSAVRTISPPGTAATPTVAALRAALAEARDAGEPRAPELLLARAAELLGRPPSLRPVLNATGVIVHTNLGRAPLAAAALDRVRAVAARLLEPRVRPRRRRARLAPHPPGRHPGRADRRRDRAWR